MPMPEIEYDPSIYSKVSWVGLVSTLDGPDPDEFPDKDGLTGSIIFKPSSPLLRFPTAVPQFTLALTNRQVNVQDAQVDEQGRKYVYLEASSPFSEPLNFTWTATFVLAYKGVPIKVPDTKFQTSPGVDVDLTDWIGFSDSVPPVLPHEGNPALEAITDAIASHSMQISGIQQTLQEMDDEMADFEAIMQGGTAGQVLTQSSNGLPVWADPSGGGGGLPEPGDVGTGGVLRLSPSGNAEWESFNAVVNDTRTEIGSGAEARGFMGTAVGPNTWAGKAYVSGLGAMSRASSILSAAIGGGSAEHPGSIAIGGMTVLDATGDPNSWDPTAGDPPSFTPGPAATTTEPNQVMIGWAHHSVEVPGQMVIGEGSARVILTSVVDGTDVVLRVRSATGDPVRIEPEGA